MKALTELRDAKQVASQRGVNLETVLTDKYYTDG